MKKIIFAFCALITLSACYVNRPDGEPYYAGAVPPFYFRWGTDSEPVMRRNLVPPFAYWQDNDSAFFTPLFGWTADKKFGYYLTPFANWSRTSPSVTENRFLLFNWRCINTELQPEANAFDGGIFPLFTVHTPTYDDTLTRSFDYSVLSILGVYQDHRREYADASSLRVNRKMSRAFYTIERSEYTDHNTKISHSASAENIFPLWFANTRTINIPTPTGLNTYLTSENLYLPLVFHSAEYGPKLQMRDSERPYFEKMDNSGLVVFPFYARFKRNDEFGKNNGLMTMGPVFLWTTNRNDNTGRSFNSFLWLFSSESEKNWSEYSFAYGLFSIRTGEKGGVKLFWFPISGYENNDTETQNP